MKPRLFFAIAVGVICGASAAYGAPITGEISIQGNDTIVSASSSAFDITFSNPANVGGTSGSFQTALGAVPPALNGIVTMIASLTNASSNFELYSLVDGTITSTLQAANISSFNFSPPNPLESLSVLGTGTLTLTGFDPTPGNFDLTTQGLNGINVTFSATQVASGIPEPSSRSVLGIALFGFLTAMWWRARRRGIYGAID